MNNIIHGANPEKLYRAFEIQRPEKIIDFSTNTNIISWPEISLNIERLASSYPDYECVRLREIISSREKIPIEKILFTNGINEAIFLLARIFDGERTAIFQPNYSEYARAFTWAENIFSLDNVKNFRAVIISNPNNPTGKFFPNLSSVIEKNPDTIFIIDEAYVDFLLFEKGERLCDFPNVVILRSLTKIFHLSGARIGYVIANEKIISELKKFLPTWNVNAFAQELAEKFLLDRDFYERTRNFYREHTPKFIHEIKSLGFDVLKSSVHFFLVRVHDDIETVKFLLRHGVVVRHTRNFLGLPDFPATQKEKPLCVLPQMKNPPKAGRPPENAGRLALVSNAEHFRRVQKYIRVATRYPDENKIFLQALSCWR